jgi:hypothetical protein
MSQESLSRRVTVYLDAHRAGLVNRIKGELMERYQRGISTSAIIARLLDEGADKILESPFRPDLDAIEADLHDIKKRAKESMALSDELEVSRLHRDAAKLYDRVGAIKARLRLSRRREPDAMRASTIETEELNDLMNLFRDYFTPSRRANRA